MEFFYPEKPRLISIDQPLFQKLSDDPRWVAEPKYNGSRLLLSLEGEKMEFWNRHGEQFGYRPTESLNATLMDFGRQTIGRCLFDGELRHNKAQGVRNRIVLWDVLVWDGKLLVNVPYRHRRMCLPWNFYGKIRGNKDFSFITQHPGNGKPFRDVFHEWTQDPEIEGMVIKNLNGKLNLSRTSGQDSNWMFKVRRPSNSYRF